MPSTSDLVKAVVRAAPPPVLGDLERVIVMSHRIDTDQLVVMLTEVKGYERIEHGKLERIAGYQAERKQGNFVDSLGHTHWGWWGAAGVLPFHVDKEGTTRFMVQLRTGGVQHSGTYSTAGGAIDKLADGSIESPEQAAMRETHEEFGEMPEGINLHPTKVDTDHHGTPGEPGHWAYHTVYLKSSAMFKPTGKGASHGFESGGFKWVTPEEMGNLPLHPDFGAYAASHLGVAYTPPPPKPPPDTRFRKGDDITFFHRDLKKNVHATVTDVPISNAPTYQVQPHIKGHPKIELKPKHILEGPVHPPEEQVAEVPAKPAFTVGPVGMPEPRQPGELRRHDRVTWQKENGKKATGEVRHVNDDGTVDVKEDVPLPKPAKLPPSTYRKGDVITFYHRDLKKNVQATVISTPEPPNYPTYEVKPHVEGHKNIELKEKHILDGPKHAPAPKPAKLPSAAEQAAQAEDYQGELGKLTPYPVGSRVIHRTPAGQELHGVVKDLAVSGNGAVLHMVRMDDGTTSGHSAARLSPETPAPAPAAVPAQGLKEGDNVVTTGMLARHGKIIEANIGKTSSGTTVHRVNFGSKTLSFPETMLKPDQ